MLFPKGQPVHENLSASFIQFDALRDGLQANGFTGYMRVIAQEYEGVLLFDTGNIVGAFDETKEGQRGGPIAAETIAVKARERASEISVYRLTDEMTLVVAGLFSAEPMYKDLPSDLTSLEKLIAKLCAEKHTGYVQVQLPDNKDAAIIFMRDGETVACTFSDHQQVIYDPDALPMIIQATLRTSALFTVYRSDLEQAYRQGATLADNFSQSETFALWQDVLRQIEMGVDSAAKSGAFLKAFRRACIAQADAFPFLDPFAVEFEYRNGQIKFEGQAPLAELNQGLCRCLAQALGELKNAGLNETVLMRKLAPALEDLKAKYGARLGPVGLKTALPNMFDV